MRGLREIEHAVRRFLGFWLDAEVHPAGAKRAYEEPREAASAGDNKEFEVIARGDVQVQGLPVPGVIDPEPMAARCNRDSDSVAIHEFIDNAFAVELHHNLA